MKPVAIVIAASLAANVVLLGALALRPSAREAATTPVAPASNEGSATSLVVAVEADQPLRDTASSVSDADAGTASEPEARAAWEKLRSDDLVTFTANLRRAGVPESTVRAIINAEINARFSDRQRALAGGRPTANFWEEPDASESVEQRLARLDLRREMEQLRAAVLGPDVAMTQSSFSDPIPAEKRDLVRAVIDDYDAILRDLRSRAGTGPLLESEKAAIAYVEEERRKDLTGLLTAQELADYEMMQTTTFRSLRRELRDFSLSEQEFRAIYAMQKEFDDRFRPSPGERRIPSREEREIQQETQAAMWGELRGIFGEQRFDEYMRARDREFQQLNSLVQRVNLPTNVAVEVYGVREWASAESVRVAADATMAPEARVAALKTIAEDARTQIRSRLNGEVGEAYLGIANGWLLRLEEGQTVRFNVNGHNSSVFSSAGSRRSVIRAGGG